MQLKPHRHRHDDLERTAAGTLSAAEMERRAQEWADAQPTVSTCAIEGCEGWQVEGTAAECREAFEAHQAEVHPRIASFNRRRREAEEAERKAAHRREMEARSAAERIPAGPAVVPSRSSRGARVAAGHGGKSLEEKKARVVAAIRLFAAEQGHPPSITGWNKIVRRDRSLPTYVTVGRWFGSWADAVVAAGFERPTRSTNYELAATRSERLVPADPVAPPPGPVVADGEAAGRSDGVEATLEITSQVASAAREAVRALRALADAIERDHLEAA
ncbi:MAG TPA: hypothetical protein VHD91_12375 [Gaiellaceae bacterium]|nr:hypothetical protein [Gaiellaceae bacterium]